MGGDPVMQLPACQVGEGRRSDREWRPGNAAASMYQTGRKGDEIRIRGSEPVVRLPATNIPHPIYLSLALRRAVLESVPGVPVMTA